MIRVDLHRLDQQALGTLSKNFSVSKLTVIAQFLFSVLPYHPFVSVAVGLGGR